MPAIAVAAMVWGLISIAILRFRRRASTPAEPPPQGRGAHGLEIAWTVIPIAIVAVLFILTVGAVNRIYGRTDGEIEVNVTAFRWQWQVDYPATGVTVVGLAVQAEMVVPVGEPVHVTLTSPDVVHSFYVPIFLFKRDAIPGRPNTFEFTVEEEGTYRGQCAEFCGVNHDRMTFLGQGGPTGRFRGLAVRAGGEPCRRRGVAMSTTAGLRRGATIERSDEEVRGLIGWLTTTDHKRIGLLYITTSYVMFLLGGVMALVMRADCASPTSRSSTVRAYNELFTMHGTIMLLALRHADGHRPGELHRAAPDRRGPMSPSLD